MAASQQIMVRFKVADYFRQGSHKTALSVPELVAQTNSFSVENRPGCSPSLLKSSPKDLFLEYNVKCTLKNSDPAGHDVKVHFDVSKVVDETTAKDLDVAVSCTCEAFLWWGAQWNVFQRDALEGEPRDQLTAPTERLDLRENFVICKHIKSVTERILPSVQHNIVKIVRQRHIDEAKKTKPHTPKPSLKERQDTMRRRQQDNRIPTQPPARNETVRKQLETGIAQREQDQAAPDQSVQRDTPATPEERDRVPVIPPDVSKPPVPATPAVADVPSVTPSVTAPPINPKKVFPGGRKPQGLPQMSPQDRMQMQRLMREDQKRQQREYAQRLRNNPGRR